MKEKNVVLVARDTAPSGCFQDLEPVLKERGNEVELFVGGGKPLTASLKEVWQAVNTADVVVLGMSSSAELADPEIAAAEAAQAAGVKYGFYGDVQRCWGRARPGAWFAKLASNTAFYFGIDQADAEAAGKVFPNARLYGTGNPLREKMAFPRTTREEVRAKLGVGQDEKLVLAPGGKFAAGNLASWAIIMEALAELERETKVPFQLALTTHPGDRTDPALYQELVSFSPVVTKLVSKDLFTTSDLVPGADLIIEFGSSIGIEGAYQQVPVVTLGLEILFRRHERAQGSRQLQAVDDGLSELVGADATLLARTIGHLLTPDGFALMRARQQALCPRPPVRGAALKNIADALESL